MLAATSSQFASLFRAEWQKIVGHRWATGFLLWIFPVGLLALIIIQFVGIVVFNLGVEMAEATLAGATWTEQVLGIWRIPSNPLGRILVVSFITIFIAGEYQWGTWKSIIPRSSRGRLLLAKFLALATAFLVAFNLMALIQGSGIALLASALDIEFVPALDSLEWGDFIKDYLIQIGLALTAVFIAAGYATIAAMIMRSIIGGILVSVGLTLIEPITFVGLFVLSQIFYAPWIYRLGRFTPFYNLENVTSWLFMDMPTVMGFQAGSGPEYSLIEPLTFSLAVLAGWAVGLTILLLFIFRRQDINS